MQLTTFTAPTGQNKTENQNLILAFDLTILTVGNQLRFATNDSRFTNEDLRS